MKQEEEYGVGYFNNIENMDIVCLGFFYLALKEDLSEFFKLMIFSCFLFNPYHDPLIFGTDCSQIFRKYNFGI